MLAIVLCSASALSPMTPSIFFSVSLAAWVTVWPACAEATRVGGSAPGVAPDFGVRRAADHRDHGGAHQPLRIDGHQRVRAHRRRGIDGDQRLHLPRVGGGQVDRADLADPQSVEQHGHAGAHADHRLFEPHPVERLAGAAELCSQ